MEIFLRQPCFLIYLLLKAIRITNNVRYLFSNLLFFATATYIISYYIRYLHRSAAANKSKHY